MLFSDIATAKVMPYEKAERIAEANNKDDPEWEYIVERIVYNKHYPTAVIRVHDEDGRCLGWLQGEKKMKKRKKQQQNSRKSEDAILI